MLPKQRLLHAAFFTPTSRGWGVPILLWGLPGVAKTSVMEQLARFYSAGCQVLAPGEMGEGAFGVVPVPEQRNGRTVLGYPIPQWVDVLGSYGLVLVDEITTAPPALQSALLGLALRGSIGGAMLAPRVRIFAAANPPGDAANGYDLPPPAANRFCHIDWTLSAADFCAYMLGQQGAAGPANEPAFDVAAEEARVMALWPATFARACTQVAGFISRKPDSLHKMPSESDPNRGRAWPSPRSWDMAARCLASGAIHDLNEDETDELGAGCVGQAAWQEFRDYLASLDLPDTAAILDGKLAWAPSPTRLDVTMAVLSSVVALVSPKDAPQRQARAQAAWVIFDKVAKAGARDLVIGPTKALISAGLFAGDATAKVVMADLTKTGFSKALSA